jgi:hypothetical protein
LTKDRSDFASHGSIPGRIRHDCRTCQQKQVKAWQQANPEKVALYRKRTSANRYKDATPAAKSIRLLRHRREKLRRYGLTPESHTAMLVAQRSLCAICNVLMLPDARTGRGACVDHDHKTGAVRGLLCGNCNRGIGLFYDNPDTLVSAGIYLEKHRTVDVAV